MSEFFEKFQQMVCSSAPHYAAFCNQLDDSLKPDSQALQGIERVRSHGLLRLALTMQAWSESKASVLDVVVLLRQVIRSYSRLRLPISLWQQIYTRAENCGIYSIDIGEPDTVELATNMWQPDWLYQASEIDSLAPHRQCEQVVGDGLLYAMSKGSLESYQSQAQQVAVHSCLFAAPGSTLLITLPTGGGKSMCILLPAWHASQGGTIKGGTSIVVVPTVALALDQEQRARHYFEEAPAPEYLPWSWNRGTSLEDRSTIRRGIEMGTLPILYISPESLMYSNLYELCSQGAENGTITRLVIDEAHLVETWGAGFRTEFQLLSTYRRHLYERSQGRLCTILLSATTSYVCSSLLRQLFASEGHFYTIQSNRLRSEPAYWFHFERMPERRQEQVLEALQYLPRPAILYVSLREAAVEWYSLLQQRGFRRLGLFTGETPTQERQRLIHAWNKHELDIMVATSAFGIGIDTNDVRTIIHACLPENLDRFYQEVGRGGRDGYSFISLVCHTDEDYITARRMNRTARITPEVAANRWEGMRRTGQILIEDRGDLLMINTNASPVDRPDMQQSQTSREWNMHTLLLMQRAGLIRITSIREDIARLAQLEEKEDLDEGITWLQIQLLRPEITAYSESEEFHSLLKVIRNKELHRIQLALRQMKDLVSVYEGPQAQKCIAYSLSALYPSCARACGSCSYCRTHDQKPYEQLLPLEVDLDYGSSPASYLLGDLRQLLGQEAVLNVIWPDMQRFWDNASTDTQLWTLLVSLVGAGIQQLIIPKAFLGDQYWKHLLLKGIGHYSTIPHQILSVEDICTQHACIPLYPLPTVVIYPINVRKADILYRRIHQARLSWKEQQAPLIHIVYPGLELKSQQGLFLDRVNGLRIYLSDLQRKILFWQEWSL